MARLRSFSAASWASPVAPSASPSAPSMSGSLVSLRVHEAAVRRRRPRSRPAAAPPRTARRPAGRCCTAANSWSVEVAVTKLSVTPTCFHWLLDGDLVLGRLAQDGDVELEAVRVARRRPAAAWPWPGRSRTPRPAPGRSPCGALGEELRRRRGRRGAGRSRWPRGRWRSRARAAPPRSRRPGWSAPVLSRTGKPTIVPPDLTTLCLDSTSSTVVASSAPPTSA